MRIIRDVGIVIRQEWRWFVGLTLLWVVLLTLGPCRRSAAPTVVRDPLPSPTTSLSRASMSAVSLAEPWHRPITLLTPHEPPLPLLPVIRDGEVVHSPPPAAWPPPVVNAISSNSAGFASTS